MKSAPLVAVTVVAATTLVAAANKWSARRVVRASPSGEAASSKEVHAPSTPTAPHGLGAGAPPSIAVVNDGGARMLHGDTRHTGRARGVAPRQRPALIWSRDVGGPVEAQVVVSPDEKVFYAASLGGNLTALSRDDGGILWTVALGDRSYATPCVAGDGTIYAGSDAHKLFAVSPQGKVQWSLETEGEADTAPAIAKDGTVVFAAGRMVYGIGPVGYVRWRYTAKRKVYSSVAIAENGRIFFGSQDHHAYALSSDGKLLWAVDLGADVDGAPALDDDGNVYFGTDAGDVVRLNPDDGRVLWRAHTGGYVRGPVSITRDGDVLAGVYGPAPREVRLSASDGSLRGDFPIQGTGAREFGVHGGAVEDERGVLLFGAQDDALYAVDASGDVLWKFPTGGDVDAPATLLGDGTVVFGSDDGIVYALRIR